MIFPLNNDLVSNCHIKNIAKKLRHSLLPRVMDKVHLQGNPSSWTESPVWCEQISGVLDHTHGARQGKARQL
jgi:hypothetical protein